MKIIARSLCSFSLILLQISCTTFSDREQVSAEKEVAKLQALFESSFQRILQNYPEFATHVGEDIKQDELNDRSEVFREKMHEATVRELERLQSIEFGQLPKKHQVSYRSFEYLWQEEIESYTFRFHQYPINQMFGIQSSLPAFMINSHQILSREDAENYLSRLKAFPRVFQQVIAHMKTQEKMDIFPPKFVYAKAIDDSKRLLKGYPFEDKKEGIHPIYKDFSKKLKDSEAFNEAEIKALKGSLQKVLSSDFKTAYTQLIAFLDQQQRRASSVRGVWALPRGSEYYRFQLKKYTSTDLSPKEIHEIGKKEVQRIQNEMKVLLRQLPKRRSLKQAFSYVQNNNRFFYPNTTEGKNQYLKDTKKIIDGMRERLGEFFYRMPQANLKVKAVEEYREQSSGIAFYQSPSEDGDRPGIYYVNLANMERVNRSEQEALAYHEAIPGHHMERALTQENEDLPRFLKHFGFTAFIEGWGLYAERFPVDYGFYSDPWSNFGRLSMELMRAIRLVVDTGLHWDQWDKDQAIQYITASSPHTREQAKKAVERYLVLPGQATAYMVGMNRILSLKKDARQALGEEFDIRDFHREILRHGALPLNLLESEFSRWLASRASSLEGGEIK
jgi:uncharacterized protein (DUF885 family)